MTHTLHRQGSVDSLKEDYPVLIIGTDVPLGRHRMRFRRKFPRIYAIVKITFLYFGIPKMLRIIKRTKPVVAHGGLVFNNKKELTSYLKELKERNTGKSVVVSGLFDEVTECLKEINLSPHTVQFSLGTFGKKELLPEEEILQITTMCGHHMISPDLVEKLASDVRNGKISYEEAVRVMSKQCVCGVFNKGRACKLMETLVSRLYSLSYSKTGTAY